MQAQRQCLISLKTFISQFSTKWHSFRSMGSNCWKIALILPVAVGIEDKNSNKHLFLSSFDTAIWTWCWLLPQRTKQLGLVMTKTKKNRWKIFWDYFASSVSILENLFARDQRQSVSLWTKLEPSAYVECNQGPSLISMPWNCPNSVTQLYLFSHCWNWCSPTSHPTLLF